MMLDGSGIVKTPEKMIDLAGTLIKVDSIVMVEKVTSHSTQHFEPQFQSISIKITLNNGAVTSTPYINDYDLMESVYKQILDHLKMCNTIVKINIGKLNATT